LPARNIGSTAPISDAGAAHRIFAARDPEWRPASDFLAQNPMRWIGEGF
jgi:hypothetical protein